MEISMGFEPEGPSHRRMVCSSLLSLLQVKKYRVLSESRTR